MFLVTETLEVGKSFTESLPDQLGISNFQELNTIKKMVIFILKISTKKLKSIFIELLNHAEKYNY